MTATPIPRTLALAALRRPGHEHAARAAARAPADRDAHRAPASALARAPTTSCAQQLDAGRQAYVVCPLIDEQPTMRRSRGAATGGSGELRAATAELERLRKGELRGYRLALLHGGMRPREKQEAMAAFASGEADVLVATTVIEVGIDVPNATVMLVENAERFGISQLHQLRGRIGRGEHASAAC